MVDHRACEPKKNLHWYTFCSSNFLNSKLRFRKGTSIPQLFSVGLRAYLCTTKLVLGMFTANTIPSPKIHLLRYKLIEVVIEIGWRGFETILNSSAVQDIFCRHHCRGLHTIESGTRFCFIALIERRKKTAPSYLK